MNTHEALKTCGDALSVGVVVGAILGWLPHIAALVSIIYTGMRMYEWVKKGRWK